MAGIGFTGGISPNRLKYGECSFNELFSGYKRDAKKRNISFSLSREDFQRLTKQNCYYCNVEPNQVYHKKYNHGNYIYNGIDRVFNDEGYTLENCVTCCKVHNFEKGKATMLIAEKMIGFKNERIKKNLGNT